MRILMLSWEYPPRIVGGLARHVQGLSQALVAGEHRVWVGTADRADLTNERSHPRLRVLRMLPDRLPPDDFVGAVSALNFSVIEGVLNEGLGPRDLDIIHVHDWLTAEAGITLGRGWNLPVVLTVHATERGRNAGIHDGTQNQIATLEGWAMNSASQVICCSDFMAREVTRDYSVDPTHIAVIPNAVDAPEDPRSPVSVSSPKPDLKQFIDGLEGPIILYVGRLAWEKGVDVLLDAFARVRTTMPDAQLIIAGTGPMEDTLRALSRDLGVQDEVRFTGFVDDKTRIELLSRADSVVVPSRYEPFGIVALEAMNAGRPLVATRVGGLREFLRDHQNSLLCPAGNPHLLAGRILETLQDREGALQRARIAQAEVSRLSWTSVAEATSSVYRALLREKRKAPRIHHGQWERALAGGLYHRVERSATG